MLLANVVLLSKPSVTLFYCGRDRMCLLEDYRRQEDRLVIVGLVWHHDLSTGYGMLLFFPRIDTSSLILGAHSL
jgi:hypothetical protein